MSALEQPELVKLIRELAEIISTIEPASGNREISEQLSEMEKTASLVERKVWYQSNIVCDVSF